MSQHSHSKVISIAVERSLRIYVDIIIPVAIAAGLCALAMVFHKTLLKGLVAFFSLSAYITIPLIALVVVVLIFLIQYRNAVLDAKREKTLQEVHNAPYRPAGWIIDAEKGRFSDSEKRKNVD